MKRIATNACQPSYFTMIYKLYFKLLLIGIIVGWPIVIIAVGIYNACGGK